MPQAAIAAGVADQILTLQAIAGYMTNSKGI
jgi:chemotaxis response regulator CheB